MGYLLQAAISASLAVTISLTLWPLIVDQLGHALRKYFTDRLTILNDIPRLGKAKIEDSKRLKGTAVICGGSVAGLLTARICADYFEDVVIVEPESWLATEDARTPLFDQDGERRKDAEAHKRARVMQYGQLHVFQPLSLMAFRQLFPKAEELFRNSGARILPPVTNGHLNGISNDSLPVEAYPNGDYPTTIVCSRDTFERVLRGLVYKHSRIRHIIGTVTGLCVNANNQKIIDSVTVRLENSTETRISASFVVDCSGPSQNGVKWLKRLNFVNLPDEKFSVSYDPVIRYRSFIFSLPKDIRTTLPIREGYDNAGTIYASFPLAPDDDRMFIITWLEGHRIMLTCGSWGNPDLPNAASEIISWIRSIRAKAPHPDWVIEIVENLLELEDKVSIEDTGRIPASTWIQYENIRGLPHNFVAIGDSVMRVNPIYGQGCSKACIGVVTLDRLLSEITNAQATTVPHNFNSKFFKKQAQRIKNLWSNTKLADYLWDSTVPIKGETHETDIWKRRLGFLVIRMRMKGDHELQSISWHSRSLLAPSTDSLHPRILAKMLIFAIREKVSFL